jgi:hypothetical protein
LCSSSFIFSSCLPASPSFSLRHIFFLPLSYTHAHLFSHAQEKKTRDAKEEQERKLKEAEALSAAAAAARKQKEAEERKAEERRRTEQALLEEQVCVSCSLARASVERA